MKISTEIGSIANKIGEEKAIEYVGKAGFDAFDYSMFNLKKHSVCIDGLTVSNTNELVEKAKVYKKIAIDNGIVCNQSHAPFPTWDNGIRSVLKLCIELTAIAGGEICVIHPCDYNCSQKNAEMFLELLPFAKSCGVKIATENMWSRDSSGNIIPAACSSPKNFLEHLNAVNDEYLVACLDIGHAEMGGLDTSAVEMIKSLNDKLLALHIHDNDKVGDLHLIPFTGDIDFIAVCKALKSINYKGYLTLEADRHFDKFTEHNAFEGVKELAGSAKRLVDIYNQL